MSIDNTFYLISQIKQLAVSLIEKELYPSFDKISETLFDISKKDIDENNWLIFREVFKKLHKNLSEK